MHAEPQSPTKSKATHGLRIFIGGFICFSSICVCGLSWFILAKLQALAVEHNQEIGQLPTLPRLVLDYRAFVAFTALIALIGGIVMLTSRAMKGAIGWLVAAASTIWLLFIFVLVLYTFITFMAPLYEYKALEH